MTQCQTVYARSAVLVYTQKSEGLSLLTSDMHSHMADHVPFNHIGLTTTPVVCRASSRQITTRHNITESARSTLMRQSIFLWHFLMGYNVMLSRCSLISAICHSTHVCMNMVRLYLYFKPAPRSMHLAQILLHQGKGVQPFRPKADQAHPLGMYSEEVMPHLYTRHALFRTH